MKNINIYGLDIGDGETAISCCKSDTITEPQMLEIHSRKQILSAIAELENNKFIIGEDACQTTQAKTIALRFKNGFINNDSISSQNIINFAREIKSYLESNYTSFNENVKVAIGCPSGFSENKKQEYINLFLQAGYKEFILISESRAAFLYARETGELRNSLEIAKQKSLIVDCGSSTTDFTFIENMQENLVDVYDFGVNNLGAGLIEQSLLDININRHVKSKKLKQILEEYPVYKTRLEFEARRVKELYFSRINNADVLLNAESSIKLYCTKPPITVDISCTSEDMNNVLNMPQAQLNGLSYIEACKKLFENVSKKIQYKPNVILLTGGASRMNFIKKMLLEEFSETRILQAMEPEFSISRGLSYALRIDIKTAGFEHEVENLLSADVLKNTLQMNLNILFKNISEKIIEYVGNNIIYPNFEKWLNGSIKTLKETETIIKLEANQISESKEFIDTLEPVVEDWLSKLLPYIEAKAYPICDKFSIPHNAFKFETKLPLNIADLNIKSSDAINFNAIKTATDLASATIFATIMGGTETALIAAGPLGLAIGAVLGLGIGAVGSDILEKQLKNADIPLRFRRLLFSKTKMKNNLKKNFNKMSTDTYHYIKKQEEFKEEILSEILVAIKLQLIKMKENALLLIK